MSSGWAKGTLVGWLMEEAMMFTLVCWLIEKESVTVVALGLR